MSFKTIQEEIDEFDIETKIRILKNCMEHSYNELICQISASRKELDKLQNMANEIKPILKKVSYETIH